ncbi:Adenylate cyclase 1 [Durusdinium trenchii]|uniref:Adenylate cyclase 1 n=1 Tax=Durusdinium trenchii TaxID=1381693 RepID=A0ABP0HJC0_9DINO
MILTIFALFAPDLDLLLGTVQSQHSLSLVMTFACFLFVVEIIVQSIGKEGYLFRAYFWLDVIALISLLPDTWLFREVFESNQDRGVNSEEKAFVAGRSSRLARLLRIASRSSKATRLNRLTRIVRVAALMPRQHGAKRVKVNDTNRVLDKKLRRVFNFIDTDMDGLIPHMAVLSVISKLKAGGNADESTALVNMLKSKVVNTLGIARKTQKSEPATIPAMLSEGTRSKTSIDFGARSKTSLEFLAESPCQSQSSAGRRFGLGSSCLSSGPGRRKFPLSKSHTSNFQAKMKDFRKLMLADEWVASRLRSACEQQLKQASNMKNLTSRHAEHVAVKVALGVLLLLFVLNLIEPSLNNSSPLRGLRFCDKFVRSEFNLTAEAEVPELVKEQVEVWLDAVGKSIGTRSLLYLDLDRKAGALEPQTLWKLWILNLTSVSLLVTVQVGFNPHTFPDVEFCEG